MGLKVRQPKMIRVFGYILSSDPMVRDRVGALMPRNCPVRERAGDGTPLGPCLYWLGLDSNTCPIHGDVSKELWLVPITMERKDMNKYGVEFDKNSLDKLATTDPTHCPDCGAELNKEGDKHILHCPNCGTKPFERKP